MGKGDENKTPSLGPDLCILCLDAVKPLLVGGEKLCFWDWKLLGGEGNVGCRKEMEGRRNEFYTPSISTVFFRL